MQKLCLLYVVRKFISNNFVAGCTATIATDNAATTAIVADSGTLNCDAANVCMFTSGQTVVLRATDGVAANGLCNPTTDNIVFTRQVLGVNQAVMPTFGDAMAANVLAATDVVILTCDNGNLRAVAVSEDLVPTTAIAAADVVNIACA